MADQPSKNLFLPNAGQLYLPTKRETGKEPLNFEQRYYSHMLTLNGGAKHKGDIDYVGEKHKDDIHLYAYYAACKLAAQGQLSPEGNDIVNLGAFDTILLYKHLSILLIYAQVKVGQIADQYLQQADQLENTMNIELLNESDDQSKSLSPSVLKLRGYSLKTMWCLMNVFLRWPVQVVASVITPFVDLARILLTAIVALVPTIIGHAYDTYQYNKEMKASPAASPAF